MKIKLENVSKTFGKRTIFKNINIEIKQGDCLVIYGSSGSGKSTLLNIIATFDKCTDGNITYFNESNKEVNDVTTIKNKYISNIYQNYFLLENDTIYKNLRIALLDKSLSKIDISKRIKIVLDLVNLDIDDKTIVNTLSGGEQQRVGIARCILRNTDIILADEPSGNLDTGNRDMIMNIFTALLRKDKTLIIATHDKAFTKIATNIIEL
jgi:putative ABC transport system ATP-binding protein